MHFAGFTAHQKSPYLENGGMIFRAAPHLPTENTDDVTGQSFTDKGSGVPCQKWFTSTCEVRISQILKDFPLKIAEELCLISPELMSLYTLYR
jgi:hypothetical protein